MRMLAGEIFGLQRKNLLFPSDCGHSVSYCLVSLMEPKTRFTAARHQSTRLDIPDLLQVQYLRLHTVSCSRFPPNPPISVEVKFDLVQSGSTSCSFLISLLMLCLQRAAMWSPALDQAVSEPYMLDGKKGA